MRPSTMLFATITIAALTFAGCSGDKERIAAQNDAAAAGDSTPRARETDDAGFSTISVFDLRVGDCISDDENGASIRGREVGDVLLARCDHESVIGEVFDLVLMDEPDGADYPGDAFIEDMANDVCDQGAPYTYLVPIADSWSNGDRTIVCIEDLAAGFEVGTCIDRVDVPLPCDDPAAISEITALIDVSSEHGEGAPYPGDVYFETLFDTDCSLDDDYYLYPSPETWAAGDRELVCTAPL